MSVKLRFTNLQVITCEAVGDYIILEPSWFNVEEKAMLYIAVGRVVPKLLCVNPLSLLDT